MIDWPTIHKMYKDGLAQAGITNPAKSNEVILKVIVDHINASLIPIYDDLARMREILKAGKPKATEKTGGFNTMCYCGTIHSADTKCPNCGR